MASSLKLLTLLPIVTAAAFACTAGGDVVPEGGDVAGTAGSSSPSTSGTTSTGTSGSAPTTAGSGPTTGGTGGAGGSGPSTAGTAPSTGGADATAGSGPTTAGTGGTGVMEEDPYEAVKPLDGWRVDMACATDPSKNFLSPNCQQGGDICWMKDDSGGRTSFKLNKKLAGDAAKLYKFRVRIRGVVEPKAFNPAQCAPQFEGDNVPMRTCKCTDAEANCIPLESGFNWMQLNISAPKQRYYINNAKDSVSHRVEILDGQFDMEVRGQADIEYFFDNLNTGEIRNCQNKLAPGLAFYEGNYFVIDIIPGSVTAAAAP